MQPGHHESRDLGGALLASVSRSFYLSIKALPARVRGPLGLAYLLARTTDTIADTAAAPVESRLKHLRALDEMIRSGPDAEKIRLLQTDIVPADGAEKELLAKIAPCLDWLAAQQGPDRADIEDVLEKIIRGQTLDLERFPDTTRVRALQNAAELEEYTYLVAGCVGEFWTRVCCRNLEDYAQLDCGIVAAMGVNFGKGLQLVNILRDMPADLDAGRCYLPADELRASGVEPGAILGLPEAARSVFNHWRERAAGCLDDGFKYIEVLSNFRVRVACFLPWLIGVKTLALLVQKYPLAAKERVKISRAEVRKIMLLAPFAAMSNKVLLSLRSESN
jgi:farnesyl-diphosphate farnesyltransferase